jgi:hypothetical protein
MASIVKNQLTEKCLRKILNLEGFSVIESESFNGKTGVDIEAGKAGVKYFIEVIGYKSSGSARTKDFCEVFFRAVSRLNQQADKCVIALPSQASNGLPQRAKHYNKAWERIDSTFPELEIWLVDVCEKSLRKTQWNDWLAGAGNCG